MSALEQQLEAFRQQVTSVDSEADLQQLKVAFLGKKGSVSQLRRQMGKMKPEERKAFGAAFNRCKNQIESELEDRRKHLDQQARLRDLERTEDLTMPPTRPRFGTLHPITRTRRELLATFRRLGFDVAEGPHIEHEAYNFDALNFQPEHPARDEQDTFFVRGQHGEEGSGIVLRTHTSPVQIRSMLTRQPPIRVVAPGTVFRRDDDPTHSPMFHQIEGLYVDRDVSMADLKATLLQFTSAFFGTGLDIRLRPSFFPFVEPGAEFDMQCPFCRGDGCNVCKTTGWIELGGSGMVHPAVFESVGIDPEEYTGWAFGFGIDRMAMLLHGIPDLRLMFDGDVRFLEQFPC